MGVREEDLGDLLIAGRLDELGHGFDAVLGERHLFVYSDDPEHAILDVRI